MFTFQRSTVPVIIVRTVRAQQKAWYCGRYCKRVLVFSTPIANVQATVPANITGTVYGIESREATLSLIVSQIPI